MSKSRRQFLTLTSLGILGAAVTSHSRTQTASGLPPGAPPAFGAGPAVGPEVLPSTFAEAQKLEPLQPGRDPGVAHNPSELMQEECDHMKAHPPGKNWNGVKEMTEK